MESKEIRQKFLRFFEKRGHAIVPSASLVPENDPSVLFTTAGMQPLVPYLLGQPHPAGQRIVNVQKCVRTQDIEEVGDNTHDTFFEMLGNWSLGDPSEPDGIGRAGYFKAEAIEWSYELLTNQEEGFGLDPKRIYVTVFEGNEDAPRDDESASIWRSIGVPEHRIYFLPAKSNWWSPGDNGPCGPDTEIFYDITPGGLDELTLEEFLAADSKQQVVEIWNNVFMEYQKSAGKVIGKLPQKNVDTGAGLERFAMVLQGKNNIFDTDLLAPIIDKIVSLAKVNDLKASRVVADHLRTAAFMIADGVTPSNTDRGYILRRLLRRAVRFSDKLEMPAGSLINLVEAVEQIYDGVYPEITKNKSQITNEISKEESKFRETLAKGLREFEKGTDPFILFTTYGFPFELTKELAAEKGQKLDEDDFKRKLEEHQNLSRSGAEQKFAGGLADHSDEVVKYHTATHLLNQALHDVLGEGVEQRGSNITSERLRFDFSHPSKMTDEEKSKVEEIVNEKIKADLPVNFVILPKAEAEQTGARHMFNEKYGDEVKVYYIGESLPSAYSKEFCGGPHVEHTGLLGNFKIIKEEAVAAGIRRIKAVLQ